MSMNIVLTSVKYGYPLILLGIIVYIFYRMVSRKRKKEKPPLYQELKWAIFALYLFVLLSVTVMPAWKFLPDANGVTRLYIFTSQEKPHINLIPFRSINQFLFGTDSRVDNFREAGIVNLIGNALLYFPFGILGVWAFKNKKKIFQKLLLSGLALCIIIEIAQYFVGRSPDIDDVILNMTGLLIGLIFSYFFKKNLLDSKQNNQ